MRVCVAAPFQPELLLFWRSIHVCRPPAAEENAKKAKKERASAAVARHSPSVATSLTLSLSARWSFQFFDGGRDGTMPSRVSERERERDPYRRRRRSFTAKLSSFAAGTPTSRIYAKQLMARRERTTTSFVLNAIRFSPRGMCTESLRHSGVLF